MDRKELKKILSKQKIPKELYSLKGGLPSEAYCIDYLEGSWQVYYSERGIKSNIIFFSDESEACKYFLELINNVQKVKP